MAYKNTAVTVCIYAWDTVNGQGKTGDSANFTLRGVGDGSEFTPSSPSTTEVDATNLPGVYKVSLTAGENNYSQVLLGGKSSSTGIVIQPIQWTNETDANVAKINNVTTSSVTTVNANMGTTQPVNFTGTGGSALAKIDVIDWLGTAPAAVTANGYLQVALLRWLTDNAAGTPNALISNRVDANAQVVGDKTGYSLAAGTLFIKKNVALSNFMFVMVNSSGTPTIGLVVTATRSIDGGAFASTTNSPTEMTNGWYKIDLSASDMNGTVIALRFTATGASDRDITIITQT